MTKVGSVVKSNRGDKKIKPSVRFSILERDRFSCRYCGVSSSEAVLQVDHVVPLSVGGSNDADNLVTACLECNSGKGDMLLDSVSAPPFKSHLEYDISALCVRNALMMLSQGNHVAARHALLRAIKHCHDIGWPQELIKEAEALPKSKGRGLG